MITTMAGPSTGASIVIEALDNIPRYGVLPISRFNITYHRQDDTDVWASAANPFSQDISTFAAAFTDKVIIYTDDEDHFRDYLLLETDTDALAVEWISASVLATGLRLSLIHISEPTRPY